LSQAHGEFLEVGSPDGNPESFHFENALTQGRTSVTQRQLHRASEIAEAAFDFNIPSLAASRVSRVHGGAISSRVPALWQLPVREVRKSRLGLETRSG
jgi:hypothetical protein